MQRIGILIDFAGGYGRDVLRGIMHVAQLHTDWEFVMPPLYALTHKKMITPRHVDGVIAMVHDRRSSAVFQRARVPIVNTARTMSLARLHAARLHSVVPDDEAAGRMAYQYFRQRGFTHFGFCGHPTGDWSLARRRAFVNCAQADGLTCRCVEHADEVPQQWIAGLPRPTALFAANDRYAWHAIDACRAAGVRVPEDIAILGGDNDELIVDMVRPALSSIEMPGFRIGVEAARLLAELMAGHRVSTEPQLLAPVSVVSRSSTDIFAMDDEVVVEAIRFIRQNADKPIRIQDVLESIAVSRRNLERRFRKALRRSLLEEIRQAHLDRACRLLRETNLDMPTVARQSGFPSHVRFSTVFHASFNMAPTAFRRAYHAH
jgi:LacI family transcriptional regulator